MGEYDYTFDLSKAVLPKQEAYTNAQQKVIAKLSAFYPPEKVQEFLRTGKKEGLPNCDQLLKMQGGMAINIAARRAFGSLSRAMDAYTPGLYDLVIHGGKRYFSSDPNLRKQEISRVKKVIGTYLTIAHAAGVPLSADFLRTSNDLRLKALYTTLKQLVYSYGNKKTHNFVFDREASKVSGLARKVFKATENTDTVQAGGLGELFVRYMVHAVASIDLHNDQTFSQLFVPQIELVRPWGDEPRPSVILDEEHKVYIADLRINDAFVEVKTGYPKIGEMIKTKWLHKLKLEERLHQQEVSLRWNEDGHKISDICLVVLSPHAVDDAVAQKLCDVYGIKYIRENDLIPFFDTTDRVFSDYKGFTPVLDLFQEYIHTFSKLDPDFILNTRALLMDYVMALRMDSSFDFPLQNQIDEEIKAVSNGKLLPDMPF